jgi:predicted RNA-binding Zn-ribbon protein involved in translation (DUF1610 family)
MARTLSENIDSLVEQCQDLVDRKFSPKCQDCGAILHPGQLRDTGGHFYADTSISCGFCISDRNHAAELEIRQCAEPAIPREETREANSRG